MSRLGRVENGGGSLLAGHDVPGPPAPPSRGALSRLPAGVERAGPEAPSGL